MVEKWKDGKMEGYIAVDANFRRVKIKAPHYVQIVHKILVSDTLTDDDLMMVVIKNEIDEYCGTFPERREKILRLKILYDEIMDEINTFYDTVKDLPLKDFALKNYLCVLILIFFNT